MRAGNIFEFKKNDIKLSGVFKAMKDKGIVSLQEESVVINGVDISQIIGSQEEYMNYIYSVKPKQYIKNGTWYDGNEHKFIRNEDWKQKEIDNQIKISQPEKKEKYMSPERWAELKLEMREMIKKMKSPTL